MFSVFHYDVYVSYSMPEHLDARTIRSRDIFYCISADQKFRVKKKEINKNLPPNHKISEKRTLTNFFLLGLMGNFLEHKQLCA